MTSEQYSQLGQEFWALEILRNKKKGVFIEIGAADGITLSNTYLLERDHGWTGLCIEPSNQYDLLVKNRNCLTDNRAILTKDGQFVDFIEDHSRNDAYLFSGVKKFIDTHEIEGEEYKKETITLDTILKQHNIPQEIDYLSIDTEGSEYEIIKDFPFYEWQIKLITIEHNYNSKKRKLIYEILSKNGFVRDEFAFSKFDDWYINRSVIAKKNTYFINKKKEFVQKLEDQNNVQKEALHKELSELISTYKDLSEKYTENVTITAQLKKGLSKIQDELKLAEHSVQTQKKIINAHEKAFTSIEESLDYKIVKLNKEKKTRRKLKRKLQQHQNKLSQLENNAKLKIKKLKKTVLEKEELTIKQAVELEAALSTNKALYSKISGIESRIDDSEKRYSTLHNSYNQLEQENQERQQRLSQVKTDLENKNEERRNLEARIAQLTLDASYEKKNQESPKDKYEDLKSDLANNQRIMAEMEQKIQSEQLSILSLKSKFEKEIDQKDAAIAEHRDKITGLEKIVDREHSKSHHLQKAYDQLLEENQKQKKDNKESHIGLISKIKELEEFHKSHKKDIDVKDELIGKLEMTKQQQNYVISYLNSKLEESKETLSSKVADFELQKEEYEIAASTILNLKHDNKLKSQQINQQIIIRDEMRTSLENAANDITALRQQLAESTGILEKHQSDFSQLQESYNSVLVEYNTDKERISQLEYSIQLSVSENSSLNTIIEEKEKSILVLHQQINTLTELNEQYSINIKSLYKKSRELQLGLDSKSIIINTMENYIESITQEVIALRNDSRRKEDRLEKMRLLMENQGEQFDSVNNENRQLSNKNSELSEAMNQLREKVNELNEIIEQKDIMIKNLKSITNTTINNCDKKESEKKEIERIMRIQENILNNQEQELILKTNHFNHHVIELESYKNVSNQEKAQIMNLTNHIEDIKNSISWKLGYFLTRLLLPFSFLLPNRNKNK